MRDDSQRRTVTAHGNGVGHAHRVELPAEHALLLDGALDDLAKVEHCPPASVDWSTYDVTGTLVAAVYITHDVCCPPPRRVSCLFHLPHATHSREERDSLARVPLPPHRRDAHLRRLLHHLLVGHARAVQHGLSSPPKSPARQLNRPIRLSFFLSCTERKGAGSSAGRGPSLTWAPGKSCSRVSVVDQRFSGPPGGRHLNCT